MEGQSIYKSKMREECWAEEIHLEVVSILMTFKLLNLDEFLKWVSRGCK